MGLVTLNGVHRLIGLAELVEYAIKFGQAWRNNHSQRIVNRKAARRTKTHYQDSGGMSTLSVLGS